LYDSRRASQSALLGLMLYLNESLTKSALVEEQRRASDQAHHLVCLERYLEELNRNFSSCEWSRIVCIHDTHQAARDVLRSFELAHKYVWHLSSIACSLLTHTYCSRSRRMVVANSDAKTTLCGGITFQLASDDPTKWIFVGGTVGDSLIYRYSFQTAEVVEISQSDRTLGVRDSGGALGGSEPDLRNLLCYACLVEDGDYLLALSDGVHDNLDPEVLGVKPSQLGARTDSWRELDAATKSKLKNSFKEHKLADIIGLNPPSAAYISQRVVDFVIETTRLQREAYEAGGLLQRDWNKMGEKERKDLNEWVTSTLKSPIGKFDHVTCLCVQVTTSTTPNVPLTHAQ